MRLVFVTLAILLSCTLLPGCLVTRHVDHTCTSCAGYDRSGVPTSEVQVEHNERHWVGFWPLQPFRAQP